MTSGGNARPATVRRGIAARPRSRDRRRFRRLGVEALLILGAVAVVAPLIYVLLLAFKTPAQYDVSPFSFLPQPWTLADFRNLFATVDVPKLMENSFIVTILSGAGMTVSSAIVAYPLARLRFRGALPITFVVLATMMLPSQVLLIPQYILFDKLGWVNTLLPLFVPSFFATSGFLVFFLRQSYRNIPRELDDAVLIDGGGHWTVFTRIILPLSRQPLLIAFILQAGAVYNDFLAPSIYLHSSNVQTIPLGIEVASASASGLTTEPVVMAGSFLFVLPLVALFLCVQKSLVRGVALGGAIRG